MNDDLALLREFARNNSEAAFATLVSRHINLVYPVALRQVRDPHLAEEITQAVFIILARKAATLAENTILSGWLCRTARYASANALKAQHRRQQREQEAYMQSNASESSPAVWAQLAPLLDGAMEKLGSQEHDALVLRFLENKNYAEVGALSGVSEAAAKKRVQRALEKLEKSFARRRIHSTKTLLSALISANAVQAAPIGLVKTVSAVAVSKGSIATASTLTLVKGTLNMMLMHTTRRVVAVAVAAAIAIGSTTYMLRASDQPAAPPGTTNIASADSALMPLDLTANYTTPASYFTNITRFPGWATVPTGAHTFKNIPLQIDGMICLYGEGNASKLKIIFPEQILGIQTHRRFDSLYVYHGSFFGSPPGTPVCRIVFRYENGTSATNQLLYSDDILDWTLKNEQPIRTPTSPRSTIAWIGGSSSTTSTKPLRFCLTEIANPQPSLEVETIDFYSTKSQTAACIMALTTGNSGLMK